ncbi:glycoside hydrolase family 16 protein [Cenococcum geophilum 1.58]|uniref:Glycoside hydrolase family 16 protein n=1 Tax=Cenococcum geophilum 1.58 TaxID=794803 RepID=A0ACC8ELW5_9PEZI|nr:glycoside hydrolase family 16 protein [Cenococcum geophilum 1.58]
MTRSLFQSLVQSTMPLVQQASTQYTLVDDYSYQNFFPNFNSITDSAGSNQYIGYLNESVYLSADFTNKTPNGRPLQMGEIDIIEGVNQQSVNTMALHTSAGCVLALSGQMTAMNYDVNAVGQGQNFGCSIQAPINPFSTSVASAGNLPVYAMERTTELISIWFFPHTGAIPMTSQAILPTPVAGTRFKDLKIVIDTTFCGAWAGKVWQPGDCAASTGSAVCEAYVR